MKTTREKSTTSDATTLGESQLAIDGGIPVRTEPLPLEFPGIHYMGQEEINAALHIALAALGVGPGQEVIVPAYMWVSVVAAIVNLGAIPVLADIDETFCLDPEAVQRRINSRTTGIVAVHMSGAQANIPV